MYRLTVKSTRGNVAVDQVQIRETGDDDEVRAAAKRICKAKGRAFPDPATVTIHKFKARRWVYVRRVTL